MIFFNLSPTFCFNPRTREGATDYLERTEGDDIVSIHAPVRVRHDSLSFEGSELVVSIHAPVRVRHFILNKTFYKSAFQSTHP